MWWPIFWPTLYCALHKKVTMHHNFYTYHKQIWFQISPNLSTASCLTQISWRLFHKPGPTTAKLLSPRLVSTQGTAGVLLEDERRYRCPCSETSWMSAYKYVGAVEERHCRTRHAILNSTRLWTSSQCNWCSTKVMWSQCHVLVSRWTTVVFWYTEGASGQSKSAPIIHSSFSSESSSQTWNKCGKGG